MSTAHRRPMLHSFAVSCWTLLAATALAQDWDPKPNRDVDEGYNKKFRPVVFVHGGSGAGEQFERQAQHFTSNGYPPTWVVAFDYSTGGGGGRGGAPGAARGEAGARGEGAARGGGRAGARGGLARGARGGADAAGGGRGNSVPQAQGPPSAVHMALDKFIDDVRKRTGHDKVDLVGHSLGTSQTGGYLGYPQFAAKVAHWASMGGRNATNPGGVPSIGVSSTGDLGGGTRLTSSNGGLIARMPPHYDHIMCCTGDEAFEAIYTFFNGETPKTLKIEPEAEPLVGGFVKSYIVNKPVEGAKVEVWEVAKETGKRLKDKPLVTLMTDADGKWGPFRAKPGQHYEYVVTEKNLPRPRHTYREPYVRTDLLVYHRVSSTAEGYSPSPLDRAPKYLSDKASVFNVRHQNGAMLSGIMSLKVNGVEILKEPIVQKPVMGQTMPTTVAIYLVDANENGKSDLVQVPDFNGAFVASADFFVPADPNSSVKFQLNNRELNVPARKSSEVGHINVVFDDFN